MTHPWMTRTGRCWKTSSCPPPRTYTGQKEEELDKHAELTIAYLALCSFLYDNRSLGAVTDQKQNELVASFLDGYNLNLMAWEV